MTDTGVLAAGAFMVLVMVLLLVSSLIVHVLRDYAEDRRREQEYADQWCRIHKARTYETRHDHADERRPE